MRTPPKFRAISIATALIASAAPFTARAQTTHKCAGEPWEQIASNKYGDARWGKVLAIFNRKPDSTECTAGRFVRLPATTKHEVRLGQTVKGIVDRFLVAPGAEALIRKHNQIPEGTEPETGKVIDIPAEIELQVGTAPESELENTPGLPDLETIRIYNGVAVGAPLPQGGTIYLPIFVEVKMQTKPPEVTEKVDTPRKDPSDPGSTTKPPKGAESSSAVDSYIPSIQIPVPAYFAGFLHADHQRVLRDNYACEHCHVDDPDAKYTYGPIPQAACLRCHPSVDEAAGSLRTAKLALTFSHDLHLDPKGKAAEGGYSLDCNGCHPTTDDGVLRGTVGHTVCVTCHNPIEVPPAVGKQCSGCHAAAETTDRFALAQSLLSEHFRTGGRGTDVFFPHDRHASEESTQGCDRCHATARTATSLDQIEPMGMLECLVCHQGLERQLDSEVTKLDRCRTCHYDRRPDVVPTFASVTKKPLSHTARFRRRHQSEAKKDDGLCQACHPALAGGKGNSCERCHAQTRPRDHTARWIEDPHGRAAERRPERCATCHLQDRCADCHNIPPRDHFPQRRFLLNHQRPARASMRRCQTCHLPEVDCARCHDVARF